MTVSSDRRLAGVGVRDPVSGRPSEGDISTTRDEVPYMAMCPFCRIVAGELDAHLLYEDEQTAAFLDDNPATDGHTLVVPKPHLGALFAADPTLSTAVFKTVHRVANAIDRTMAPDGISLFYTTRGLVGSVDHAHVHLVPRYRDDDIHLALFREQLDDSEARELVARLKDTL